MGKSLEWFVEEATKITTCFYNASSLKNAPIGMFRCPMCGTTVFAGDERHEVDPALVIERVIDAFKKLDDNIREDCAKIAEDHSLSETSISIAQAIRASIGKGRE